MRQLQYRALQIGSEVIVRSPRLGSRDLSTKDP